MQLMGAPKQAPVEKNWSEMYFHEKIHHLVDFGADVVFSYSKYWMPAICVAMATSIYVFGGENAVNEAIGLTFPVLSPTPVAPNFGTPSPPSREEEEEEEE